MPRVVISAGGPYVASSTAQQNFRGSIDVPAKYFSHPLELVCKSGTLTAPGFNWVRMILLPDKTDVEIQDTGQPIGRLLVDERSFLKSPISYTDVSGQFHVNENKFVIEAAGPAGSVFSWELRSIGPPTLYNASGPLIAGQVIILYGTGFSLRPDENWVTINGYQLPVMACSATELKVRLPKGLAAGDYKLVAAIRQYASNALTIYVQPPVQQSK